MNANIDAAKAKLWQATQDYNRYSNLYQDHSITKQQFEQARTAMLEAQATVKGLKVRDWQHKTRHRLQFLKATL